MKEQSENFRSQLKATSIKKLKKRVESDNETIGVQSNEYLNLEDGKTLKIRIFPAHPGLEDFYIPKKSYWLSVGNRDGELRRTTVLDSKIHGGTKFDLIEEYVKMAKKKWAKDSEKLDSISGSGQNQNSLNPSYTWLCYADRVNGDEELHAKLWEFKKTVRDSLNKLAFSEDEDEAIEVDPFTDPDEGLPILVKYMKNPNKKRGENFYEVTFPKKASPRPLSDSEIEHFMSLKPLNEIISKYGMRDFEKALEGLQNFDEEHKIQLFEDDDFLEHVEEIKKQYDLESEDDEKLTKRKVFKKISESEDEEDDEPVVKKAVTKKPVIVEDEEDEEDELEELDRIGLKNYIKSNNLEVSVKKSMSDNDIRESIRNVAPLSNEDADVDEDEEPKAKISLSDIKAKLAGKK